jgi:hypothetical protein
MKELIGREVEIEIIGTPSKQVIPKAIIKEVHGAYIVVETGAWVKYIPRNLVVVTANKKGDWR